MVAANFLFNKTLVPKSSEKRIAEDAKRVSSPSPKELSKNHVLHPITMAVKLKNACMRSTKGQNGDPSEPVLCSFRNHQTSFLSNKAKMSSKLLGAHSRVFFPPQLGFHLSSPWLLCLNNGHLNQPH